MNFMNMSTPNLLDKYQPPKNQAPSKVRRFPLYRRAAPAPAPASPPAKNPPKEEKPAPPPSTWSNWQFIKEPQWQGYWRASAQEDGGWHYHFTKDGTTVWEQKLPKPTPQKPSTVEAKTIDPRDTMVKNKYRSQGWPEPHVLLTTQLPPRSPIISRDTTLTVTESYTAAAKPTLPSALKQPHPPANPATSGQHSVKTVASAPTSATTSTTVTATESIPSYTVKKPEPPKPSVPPKKVTGTITLHTKSGKAVTVPLPDPGKPVVIRTLLEE